MEFKLQPIKREIELKGFNSIYYFEFGKDFSHPPERHDFWEMVYVDSGEINAVTDGLGRKLSQGQVIFHRPMEVHAHVSNLKDPNDMLVVSFTTHSPAMEYFDKKIFTLGKTEKTLLSLFINEARTALGSLPNEYSNKNPLDFSSASPLSFQLLECYLTELLLVLLRGGEGSESKSVSDENPRALAQSSRRLNASLIAPSASLAISAAAELVMEMFSLSAINLSLAVISSSDILPKSKR